MKWSSPIYPLAGKTAGLLLLFSLFGLVLTIAGYAMMDHAFWSILTGFLAWSTVLALNCWFGVKLGRADDQERAWQIKRKQRSRQPSGRRSLLEQANSEDFAPEQLVSRERYPNFFNIGQWVLWVPLLGVWVWSLIYGFARDASITTWDIEQTRLLAILLLLVGLGVVLTTRYCQSLELGEARPWLTPLFSQSLLSGWVLLAASGVLFLEMFTGWEWAAGFVRVLAWILVILLVDAVCTLSKPLFQPPTNRLARPLVGGTFLLGLLFQRMSATKDLLAGLEKILGVPLNELWFWRSLKIYTPPFLIAVLILLWLTSMFTVVPLGYKGVKVQLGEYQREALGAGLHYSYPWPWGGIELVPADRVQVTFLGHARDLGAPILWTEQHYEGETTLLIGDGEELLTVNVPVFYRINDPYLYLINGRDSEQAIPLFAAQYLLEYAIPFGSYEVMTVERDHIAAQVKESLQAALDRKELGIEILEVSLKDIHPPLETAEAYQEVVSAEEERRTMIEEALAYAAETMPEAIMEARRMVLNADAEARSRTLMAEAETVAFRLLQPEFEAGGPILRHGRRLESLERALEDRPKIILPHHPDSPARTVIDLRNNATTP